MPQTHTILTVFDAEGLENAGTFDSPAGGGWSLSTWDQYAYMITSTVGSNISGNTTSSLEITVAPGDTINWLDTPISQGMRHDNSDFDMVIYGMSTGDNWSNALGDLTPSFPNMSHAYISENFNSSSEPKFTGVGYPNNVCSTTVNLDASSTTVSYYLKVVKLNVMDLNKITPVGWYALDPTIKVVASA